MAEQTFQESSAKEPRQSQASASVALPSLFFARASIETACDQPHRPIQVTVNTYPCGFLVPCSYPLLESQSPNIDDQMQASCTGVADRWFTPNFQNASALFMVKPSSCQPPIV
jgi:hypothetical protein